LRLEYLARGFIAIVAEVKSKEYLLVSAKIVSKVPHKVCAYAYPDGTSRDISSLAKR
jgi:hypothetical protein